MNTLNLRDFPPLVVGSVADAATLRTLLHAAKKPDSIILCGRILP